MQSVLKTRKNSRTIMQLHEGNHEGNLSRFLGACKTAGKTREKLSKIKDKESMEYGKTRANKLRHSFSGLMTNIIAEISMS